MRARTSGPPAAAGGGGGSSSVGGRGVGRLVAGAARAAAAASSGSRVSRSPGGDELDSVGGCTCRLPITAPGVTSASQRARSPRRGAAPERERRRPPPHRVLAGGPRGDSAGPPPLPRPPSSMSPRRGGGCLGDALSGPPWRSVGRSSSAQPGAPQLCPAAAAWRSRAPAAAPGASHPLPPPGARGEGGGRPPGKMKAEGGDHSMINLSVQQVLSLWAHGTVLRNLTGNWRGDGGRGCGATPRLLPPSRAGEALLAAPPRVRLLPGEVAVPGPGPEGL